jgi:hypothetical protein
MAVIINCAPSLPGLTRQSIDLRKKFFANRMDARIKPAHDEARLPVCDT